MEYLLALDHALYFFIRNLPQTPIVESVALTLSGVGSGGLIWLVLSLLIFVRIEKREHWFFLPVASVMGLGFLITNLFLKNYFGRNRPPGAFMDDYSFPSGHATFAWAFAVVLSTKEPRLRFFYLVLALLISLSRIYLGKHYPADVATGAVVGVVIGYASLYIEQKVIQYRHAQAQRKRTSNHRSRSSRR